MTDEQKEDYYTIGSGGPVTVNVPKPIELRDYFAAKAMAALIVDGKFYDDSNVGIEDIAVNAYMFADAMLVERAAKGDK